MKMAYKALMNFATKIISSTAIRFSPQLSSENAKSYDCLSAMNSFSYNSKSSIYNKLCGNKI